MVSLFGTDTSPSSGDSSPTIMRKRVVLPAPFGPTRPIRSPGLSWNDVSTKRICLPYCLLIRLKLIIRPLRVPSALMSIWEWLGLASEKAADTGNRLEEIESVLAGLGTERARHLACFAYILTRPARADHQVTDSEAAQMQRIIIEHASVTEEQAAAIVRVAREAARQSGGT